MRRLMIDVESFEMVTTIVALLSKEKGIGDIHITNVPGSPHSKRSSEKKKSGRNGYVNKSSYAVFQVGMDKPRFFTKDVAENLFRIGLKRSSDHPTIGFLRGAGLIETSKEDRSHSLTDSGRAQARITIDAMKKDIESQYPKKNGDQ